MFEPDWIGSRWARWAAHGTGRLAQALGVRPCADCGSGRTASPFATLAAVLGLALLAGCAGASEPTAPATEVVIRITAVKSLNPDPQGRASPIEVRLYQLSDAAPFETASYADLVDRAAAALGETLVAQEELDVAPAESATLRRALDPSTRRIGVVATFRESQLSTWRDLVEVPPNAETTYALALDSLSVSIEPAAE